MNPQNCVDLLTSVADLDKRPLVLDRIVSILHVTLQPNERGPMNQVVQAIGGTPEPVLRSGLTLDERFGETLGVTFARDLAFGALSVVEPQKYPRVVFHGVENTEPKGSSLGHLISFFDSKAVLERDVVV